MEFEQKILHYLLTEGCYKNSELRPDDIKRVTAPRSFNVLNIEINALPIEQFQPLLHSEQTLSADKKDQYVYLCLLSQLDDEKATELSLSPKQIIKLRSLSYQDITQLTNGLSEDIVKLNIKKDVLDWLILQSKEANKTQHIIEQLVKAGATKKFMNEEYMLSPRKYKFLRNAFQLESGFGRPRILTEKESHEVYELWKQYGVLPIGEAYLKIFEEINKTASKQIHIRNIANAIDEINNSKENVL